MKLKTLKNKRGVTHCENEGCTNDKDLTIEHRIPKAFLKLFNLSHLADNDKNLQIFCSICNERKGDSIDLTKEWDTVQRILTYAKEMQKEEKKVQNLFE